MFDPTLLYIYLNDYTVYENRFLYLLLTFMSDFVEMRYSKIAELGKKKEEEAPAAPPEPTNEEKLLTEIRDLLKK